ncbi:MAG: STAS domain-containing protein [Planctomycetes bacterium]|nr:STAS domain-containing protein [Planctomycetota bacterium]
MHSISVESGRVEVVVAGKLSRDDAQEMALALEDLLEENIAGCSRLLVDIAAVEYLSSSGLGALVRMFEAAKRRGLEMTVYCVRPEIRSLIELAGIDRLIRVVDSKEDES